MEYSLGRQMEISDRPEIDRILEKVEKEKLGFQDLVTEVVTSVCSCDRNQNLLVLRNFGVFLDQSVLPINGAVLFLSIRRELLPSTGLAGFLGNERPVFS